MSINIATFGPSDSVWYFDVAGSVKVLSSITTVQIDWRYIIYFVIFLLPKNVVFIQHHLRTCTNANQHNHCCGPPPPDHQSLKTQAYQQLKRTTLSKTNIASQKWAMPYGNLILQPLILKKTRFFSTSQFSRQNKHNFFCVSFIIPWRETNKIHQENHQPPRPTRPHRQLPSTSRTARPPPPPRCQPPGSTPHCPSWPRVGRCPTWTKRVTGSLGYGVKPTLLLLGFFYIPL